jgi:hypothetical protein
MNNKEFITWLHFVVEKYVIALLSLFFSLMVSFYVWKPNVHTWFNNCNFTASVESCSSTELVFPTVLSTAAAAVSKANICEMKMTFRQGNGILR